MGGRVACLGLELRFLSRWQSGCAFGQRGWNRQPEGGLIGRRHVPVRMIRCLPAAASGSAAGAADSSAAVYGCRGEP